MKPKHIFLFILLLTLIVSIGHLVYYYSRLPEIVATKFDGQGNPTSEMSKSNFAMFYMGMMVFLTLMFGGIGFLTRFLPPSMINLPHKEYWLDDSRKSETLDFIDSVMLIIGISTNVLMIVLTQFSIIANLNNDNLSQSAIYLLVVYLVFLTLICVGLVFRFRKPKTGE